MGPGRWRLRWTHRNKKGAHRLKKKRREKQAKKKQTGTAAGVAAAHGGQAAAVDGTILAPAEAATKAAGNCDGVSRCRAKKRRKKRRREKQTGVDGGAQNGPGDQDAAAAAAPKPSPGTVAAEAAEIYGADEQVHDDKTRAKQTNKAHTRQTGADDDGQTGPGDQDAAAAAAPKPSPGTAAAEAVGNYDGDEQVRNGKKKNTKKKNNDNEQTGGTEVGVGAQGVHGAMPGPAVDPLAAAAAGATPAGMAHSTAESESKP